MGFSTRRIRLLAALFLLTVGMLWYRARLLPFASVRLHLPEVEPEIPILFTPFEIQPSQPIRSANSCTALIKLVDEAGPRVSELISRVLKRNPCTQQIVIFYSMSRATQSVRKEAMSINQVHSLRVTVQYIPPTYRLQNFMHIAPLLITEQLLVLDSPTQRSRTPYTHTEADDVLVSRNHSAIRACYHWLAGLPTTLPIGSSSSGHKSKMSSTNESTKMELRAETRIFVVLLLSLEDAQAFSSLLCRLRDKGYEVYVFLRTFDASSRNVLANQNGLGSCLAGLKKTIQEISPGMYENANAFNLVDVVIMLKEMRSLFRFPDDNFVAGVTVIQIPQVDLPATGWISVLSPDELSYWHKPKVDISIIANNRSQSLQRLLNSLSKATYFGDSLNIRINMESTTDSETQRIIEDYQWPRGVVILNHRIARGGLLASVAESWYPWSNDHYGLLLEDDIELSPMFYAWIKMTLLRYRYDSIPSEFAKLFGISLYQQKALELPPSGRRPFNARILFQSNNIISPHTPYVSPIPCSWGGLYFPEHWREFHHYLSLRLGSNLAHLGNTHIVPNIRSNRWKQSWKKYFIELAYLHGYVMLYPNYPGFVSFSTNHLEPGSHVKAPTKEKKALFEVPLMSLPEPSKGEEPIVLELPNAVLPTWQELPVVNLTGHITTLEQLEFNGKNRLDSISICASHANHATNRSFCI